MRDVTWLIEEDVFGDGTGALAAEAWRQGHQVERMQYVPFQPDEDYRRIFEAVAPLEAAVVFYGTANLAERVRRLTGWRPGAFGDPAKFLCRYYYPRLSDVLFNSDGIFVPYGRLAAMGNWLFNAFGQDVLSDPALFVRPDVGDKPFKGQLVRSEAWDSVAISRIGGYGLRPEDLIVVAEPCHTIAAEYRFVIVDGLVVAGSSYRVAGQLQYGPPPADVTAWLTAVIDENARRPPATRYDPGRVWVADVAQTEIGRPAIIEVGDFSCSGLYGCDLGAVVAAVSAAAIEEATG